MEYYPLPAPSAMPRTVILANGEYPRHPLPLSILGKARYVVCCDGAADEFIRRGNIPGAIVGDGDSFSDSNRRKYADICFFNPDQETNDQTKALKHCVDRGMNSIIIVGATGKREDHTLGNISLLTDYMDIAKVELVTDYGVFTPARHNGEFEAVPGGQVSIINFGAEGLRGENLAYPLSDFTNWWQGTLNESNGESFRVYAHGKYLVFRTHEILI